MRFADITGQRDLVRHLTEGVDRGRVSHAQLFTGAAGTGALPLAIAYAQYLNCTDRHDGDSCGRCPSCVQTAALAHPDVHFVFPVNKQGKKSGETILSGSFMPEWREMVAATGGYFSLQQWYDRLDLGRTLRGMISAREADEIIRSLSFKSFESEYKITIIWQPETMTEDAANKILKILEEPWEKTVFLLVSERPDLLLPTIVSRTQEVAVPRVDIDSLAALAVDEPEERKRRNMARLAAGDVLRMRRLVSGTDDQMQREGFDLFCRLMRLSYNDRHLELIEWAEDVAQLSREQQLSMLTNAARLFARELHAACGSGRHQLPEWGDEAAFCDKFAPYIGNGNIEPLIAQIESAMRQITQNGNPRIVFTHFALAVSKHINRLPR